LNAHGKGGDIMLQYIRHLQDLPEESLGVSWSGVSIKRVIHPKLVGSIYLSVNILKILPGCGTPNHIHYKSEEAWGILEGEGIMRINGKDYLFGDGDVLYVPAGVAHQVVCRGKTILRYFAITAPPIDLEEDNIVLEPYNAALFRDYMLK
jgi:mannose-6-phosphate isomerase-like protein (cupin superfamily)